MRRRRPRRCLIPRDKTARVRKREWEGRVTAFTCTKRDVFTGFEALQRLAKQKDEKGLSWPIKVAYPISENLIKLEPEYRSLVEARKSSAERLMAKGLELAVRDGKGNPLPKGSGYVLTDPNAFREEEKREEAAWEDILRQPVEIEIIRLKLSELVTAMGGEANVRFDGDDLALLRRVGVVEYDLGTPAEAKK